MAKIKELMNIEEILLKSDTYYRYEYSIDELVKSSKYLSEIGEITNLFFTVQLEYSQTVAKNNYELNDYKNRLMDGDIDIDISKYITFINTIKNKVKEPHILLLIEKLNEQHS